MRTNRQGFLDNLTTGRTLLGGILWRYAYDLFALLNSLVFQIQQKLIPSGIIDGLVQTSLDRASVRQVFSIFILNRLWSAGHPLDVQILMANHIAELEQGIRSLVQKIMSLATDFVMAFPDCFKQLVPPGRPFLCLGKSSLQTGKFVQGFSQELRG